MLCHRMSEEQKIASYVLCSPENGAELRGRGERSVEGTKLLSEQVYNFVVLFI